MASITTPFADGVDKLDPVVFNPLTDAQLSAGFSCGPADLGTFNWLFNQAFECIIELNTATTAAQTNITQGTIV